MPSRGPVALQRQRRQLLHPASAVAAREPGPPGRGPWAAAWPFVSRTTRRWNRPPRRPRPGGTVLPRTVPDKFAGRNAGKKRRPGTVRRGCFALCRLVRALRGVLARPLYSLAAGTTGGVSFRLQRWRRRPAGCAAGRGSRGAPRTAGWRTARLTLDVTPTCRATTCLRV